MARLGRRQPFPPKFKRPDLGPVYFDRTSNSGYISVTTPVTWTHVVGTNSNRLLVVTVSVMLSQTVTSITAGGTGLTFLRADTNGSIRSEIWYLIAPTSGSQTISVNLSFFANTTFAVATSYWNVDQTSPIDANNGATGTGATPSASVTTVANNTRVIGHSTAATTSLLVSGDNQALRGKNSGGQGSGISDEKGTILTGASTTMQWSGNGAGEAWTVSLASIKPVTSGDTITTKTLTGVSRIQKSVSQTITGTGRIEKSVSQTITGLSRIQKSVSQTTTGVARIQVTVEDAFYGLFTGKARIQKNVTRTITGVARIQQNVSQTIAGVAKITANTTKTTNGVTRIQNSATQTSTGTARIEKSTTQTITGTGRIQKSVTSTITGVARIQKAVLQTIAGVARIQKSASQTTTGVAVITAGATQTTSGVARIQKSVSQTTTGLARIQKNVSQTIMGVAKITTNTTTTQTITGVANIYSPYVNQNITGVARIQRQDWYEDNPAPFETSASSGWYTDNPQSFKTNASSAWYDDASGTWETEDF